MQDQTLGTIHGAQRSITSYPGKNLQIESTSLAVMAWLEVDSSNFREKIELGIKYLMKSINEDV